MPTLGLVQTGKDEGAEPVKRQWTKLNKQNLDEKAKKKGGRRKSTKMKARQK